MVNWRLGRWTGLAALLALVGCASEETILPGERLGLDGRPPEAAQVNRSLPISLPAQRVTGDWTHRASAANHRAPHAAMAATPALRWAAPIGEGSSQRHRITAEPVSDGVRVFAMDSRATVSAIDTAGNPVWTRDLTRGQDRPQDASGGGLTVVAGTLYVTTGFGDLYALDATSGAERWRQRLGAPATGAATVFGDQVYLTTRNSQGWVLDAENGRLRWQVEGAPSAVGVANGSAPAVGSTYAVFPFGSGQVTATYRREGFSAWQSSVTGGRLGQAYARVTDVSADPVIASGRVYVGNPGGRLVALDLDTGSRIWTAEQGALGPVVVAGNSVFLVNDQAQIVRLVASNGDFVWASQLPQFLPVRNELRRRDVYAHYGPVLAGGQLWVASDDGMLRSFDARSGTMTQVIEMGSPAAAPPIVVGRTLYVVGADGTLRAFN